MMMREIPGCPRPPLHNLRPTAMRVSVVSFVPFAFNPAGCFSVICKSFHLAENDEEEMTNAMQNIETDFKFDDFVKRYGIISAVL